MLVGEALGELEVFGAVVDERQAQKWFRAAHTEVPLTAAPRGWDSRPKSRKDPVKLRWLLLAGLVAPSAMAFPAASMAGGPQAHASAVLETIVVKAGGGAAGAVTTKTSFQANRTYLVKVTGTVSNTTTDSAGKPYGFTYDAVYCYAGTDGACKEPPGCCTHTLRVRDGKDSLYSGMSYYGTPTQPRQDYPDNPAYRSDHTYTWAVQAEGPLHLYAIDPAPDSTPSGQFTVEISLPTAPADQPLRVKFAVDALRNLDGGKRSTLVGGGTLRGKPKALKPTRTIRLRHVAVNGSHYTLRVTAGSFSFGNPNVLALTATAERSDDPRCRKGATWHLTLRRFDAEARKDRVSLAGTGCRNTFRAYSQAARTDRVELTLDAKS